jgi:hypothetical protein
VARRIEHAKGAPGDPLAALLAQAPAPPFGVSLLIAIDAAPDPAERLPALIAAVSRVWSIPPGRMTVLLAAPESGAADAARARELTGVSGVLTLVHDPERSTCCGFGIGPHGVPLEMNDELREAEAVLSASAGAERPALFPGLASARALALWNALDPVARAEVCEAARRAVDPDAMLVGGTTDATRCHLHGRGAAAAPPPAARG